MPMSLESQKTRRNVPMAPLQTCKSPVVRTPGLSIQERLVSTSRAVGTGRRSGSASVADLSRQGFTDMRQA
ncbi:hypothetical protein MGG_15557 [Pyricularia oryzae 70-15]|uniref:Uncharacterized protein n=4 Tax=Pyricularia TaxID=48558 RepID=G4MTC5_PYRO7|nr:uncharacterized protein MGG_15557 [Pyricularia oryzae 70-15]EHA53871.1 hypothetical protein MGG_15557 [Pyricularia oryzae 70-15]ELQ42782.1 hypothetical protein OOU_Y34scaffold00194g95 [Pyricularia oryzae Y34]KAI6326342.1 hypothetical protein MCOR34_000760 [Pyricularia oryzae]KAI6471352.1 hypothetical protein MCOR17_003221 [Pyricularia oryzae]